MDLIKKIQEAYPNQNFVFAAATMLKTPEEIRQFYQEYVAHLKEYGSDKVKSHPELTAKANLSVVMGHCNVGTVALWKSVLPDLTDNPLLAITKGYM